MLEHAKVIWLIRTSLLRNQKDWTHILCWNMPRSFDWWEHLLRNQRHWAHILCWNMPRSFDWWEHLFWEIRGTGLTSYVRTCQGHLTDENISFEKSEALGSHPMLEHAKVIWLMRTFLLRNQRHWTHLLCWNMPRSFDWWEHLFWEIRGTGLTSYVRRCQGHLTDENISFEKSEALDSPPMLEHAKVIWLMRISLLRNQRHWTHKLCWNMPRSFDWWEYLVWEIRGTGLTCFVRTCQGHLTDENISSEKSEALDSQAMLEHAKVIWLMRTFLLRNQRHWTHILCLNMPRPFDWWEHLFWEIRGTRLTIYVRTCQSHLTDENISSEKSEALDSQAMLEHAKVNWLMRISLLRNQRHWTHMLCWNMPRSFNW